MNQTLNQTLVRVSLRQQAVYLAPAAPGRAQTSMTGTTTLLVANLARLGYGVSEPLLRALEGVSPTVQADLLDVFREVTGVNKNWTPLVKGWDTPTGEDALDHLITWLANAFGGEGTRLPCGHVIPPGTFPLERYNGCPFCGTPFEFGQLEHLGQGSKQRLLALWTDADVQGFLRDLLASKTALDATQLDSLQRLLAELPPPAGVPIAMKETLMAVIDAHIRHQQPEKAQPLFASPTDVLRYLWFKKTGFYQLLEPKTIRRRKAHNSVNRHLTLDASAAALAQATLDLKLRYGRKEAAMVAGWLNALPQSPAQLCEIMHPKRGMWVRFIRALRLAEYSKRPALAKLRETLDLFYNQRYEVWQGRVNHLRLRAEATQTFALLQQRPGLFARSLFANMLWFGPAPTIAAFAEVIDRVPARLVFTLNAFAENYFDKDGSRVVKPLGGISKTITANKLLGLYDDAQLQAMQAAVGDLCLLAVRKRFAARPTTHRTMHIDPLLFKLPVSIGDRSDNVQNLPAALMGTRFAVEGDTVRLFMQWGTGLPAQHLDMDLSCSTAFADDSHYCSFSQLVTTGCKHSGDIQRIPDQVGTAEYIDIDVNALQKAQAQYVTFACNAYSNGAITPNLVLGWMSSRHPMRVSESGVAYDPSCVQQQVRITSPLAKGLVFGVLDVAQREIIWLEMPFGGQIMQNMSLRGVRGMLARLDSKLSIGQLLTIKAEAQNLTLVDVAEADEVYTPAWAQNTAAVTQLLVD